MKIRVGIKKVNDYEDTSRDKEELSAVIISGRTTLLRLSRL